MLPKRSMAIIVEELAKRKFLEHCTLLDGTIERELRQSFSGERISEARVDRIVKKFAKNMMDTKL